MCMYVSRLDECDCVSMKVSVNPFPQYKQTKIIEKLVSEILKKQVINWYLQWLSWMIVNDWDWLVLLVCIIPFLYASFLNSRLDGWRTDFMIDWLIDWSSSLKNEMLANFLYTHLDFSIGLMPFLWILAQNSYTIWHIEPNWTNWQLILKRRKFPTPRNKGHSKLRGQNLT